MTIGNLLLHAAAETVDPACGPAAWALGLAAETGTSLTALTFELNVLLTRPNGQNGDAVSNVGAETRHQDAVDRAERLRSAATEAGIDAQVITERSFAYGIPEIVADHARLHDIVVCGVDQTGLLSERSIAEHLLFESGRPVVVVQSNYSGPFRCERIVVAWDWSRAAARAVGDAMPLLCLADEVSVVTFGDEKQFDTSLSQEQLCALLKRRGLRVRFDSADRAGKPIGEALCSHALDRNADLLVMGGYGHSRLRRFVLGGATRSILDGPGLPTLLSH